MSTNLIAFWDRVADAISEQLDVTKISNLSVKTTRGSVFLVYDANIHRYLVFRAIPTDHSRAFAVFMFNSKFVGNSCEFGLAPMLPPLIVSVDLDGTCRKFVVERTFQILSPSNTSMDLLTCIQRENPTHLRLLYHLKNVVSSVAKLHAEGYFHMDISPENIVLSSYQGYLVDFESVLACPPVNHYVQRRSIQVPVKDAYLPVEHFLSEPEDYVSIRGYDVWAIGCVLFVVLFRRCLFDSPSEENSQHEKQINYFHKNGLAKYVERFDFTCRYNDPIACATWDLLKRIFRNPRKLRHPDGRVAWSDGKRMQAEDILNDKLWIMVDKSVQKLQNDSRM